MGTSESLFLQNMEVTMDTGGTLVKLIGVCSFQWCKALKVIRLRNFSNHV